MKFGILILGAVFIGFPSIPIGFGAERMILSSLEPADAAYQNRSDLSQARESLNLYEKFLQENPDSVDAHWKASRAAWWVAENSESSKNKIEIFKTGIDLAKEAVRLDPNSLEGHFWLGLNYGSYGESRGVLKSLFLIKPIRAEMAFVLDKNPNFLGGGAHRVLGVMDYKVPGMFGGDKKRALERLEKALSTDPKNPYNYYYLAEYFETVGDRSHAY